MSGDYGTGLGYQSIVSGNYAIAMGYNDTASGSVSTAIGYRSNASGNYSHVIGSYGSTEGYTGAMILSDVSVATRVKSTVNNQLTARFSGGYRLFSNLGMTTGIALAAGGTSWSSISDRRAKTDILHIQYGLAEVLQLNPTQYRYKGNAHTSIGFIAQEVVDIIPEIVEVPADTNDYMSIRYTEMVPVLTKAIQELSEQNESLNSRLEKQQEEINALRALILTAQKEG